MSDRRLFMWTIYDHPSDFPDCFVARKWLIEPSAPVATNETITSPEIDQLRNVLENIFGLVRLARSDDDDPKIVETWI